MTRIKKLSFVLIGLLFISLILYWYELQEKAPSIDKGMFAIADTTQVIGITIESKNKTVAIQRQENKWLLNDEYGVDPGLIYLSMRILNAVQTQRPVSRSNFDALKNELKSSARKVSIALNGGQSKSFYAGGNAAKTTAYFASDDWSEIYLVTIPGYKSYLSGIFELSPNQWRDRMLFASSWRTIQRLQIDYVDGTTSDLNIFYDKQFLAVEHIAELDTAVLMNYLQPLEFFQVNDYLDQGSFSKYDSLLSVEPLANLSLEDIDAVKNKRLIVYPKIPGERFYLVTDQSQQMIVVDQQRMENLLAEPSLFEIR